MTDEKEIKLPISGEVVVIRNYTTFADDEKAEEVLFQGVEAIQGSDVKDQKVSFPMRNVMASSRSYINRLVKSINGDSSNIALRLKDLRSEDFKAVEAAVEEVVDQHSPKAKAAKKS